MKKLISRVVAIFLLASFGPGPAAASQEAAPSKQDIRPISYDNWQAAKLKAEEYDRAGKFAEALQHYLEYARQAEGLGRRDLVAWGKNNAAYMMIKMHKQDPTVDLAPAKKFLEDALAIAEASADCKRVLASNLEYVRLYLRPPD